MSDVMDRLRKRRAYPLDIGGEIIHIRSMTKGERLQLEPIQNDSESFGFVIGCGLVNEDGSALFTVEDGEGASEFGSRVEDALGLPDDTRSQISEAIARLSRGPTPEQLKALKKN